MIELKKGKYKIYHIPGVKIGCTTNVKKRVEEEQGYKPGELRLIFKKMIHKNKWEFDDQNIVTKWFEDNKDVFKHFGGDIETLLKSEE